MREMVEDVKKNLMLALVGMGNYRLAPDSKIQKLPKPKSSREMGILFLFYLDVGGQEKHTHTHKSCNLGS